MEDAGIKILVGRRAPTLTYGIMVRKDPRYVVLFCALNCILYRFAICLFLLIAPATAAYAADSAVIVMYHRFGEPKFPTTNVSLEQFESHIGELTNGSYTVLSLPDIISALREGRKLPDRAIGISIDDAYRSVYNNAWPRLRAAGLPFTLFVATEAIDRRGQSYMSWEQIREMQDAGIAIGSQTHTHLHMAASPRLQNEADIAQSNRRFAEELGRVPTLFAYPYGEMSLDVRATIIDAGFIAAFGQHSGVVHPIADRYFLPRFAFNETYGGIDRLRTAANALPLPVRDITPADPLLTQNPPDFGFSVDPTIDKLDQLACYNSQQGRLNIERLGASRIELRFAEALPRGRSRINCTMPGGNGRWRWFGRQFLVDLD